MRHEATATKKRRTERLNVRWVATADTPGLYPDGKGLYLQIGPTGTKSWLIRYSFGTRLSAAGRVVQRERYMGIGSASEVSLKEARDAAVDCSRLLRQGLDPIEARKSEKAEKAKAEAAKTAKAVTFGMAVQDFVKSKGAGWKSDKHRQQYETSLKTHCAPLWDMPVADVGTDEILQCLTPQWATKTVTLTRVRQRVWQVLEAARVRKLRSGANPATWRGELEHVLAKPKAVHEVKNFDALAYSEVPNFVGKLKERQGMSARAMEFAILQAARTGAVLNMEWAEVDLQAGVWTIPPLNGRKVRKPHRAPLSRQAIALLEATPKMAGNPYVFTSPLQGRSRLGDAALRHVLEDMKTPVTTHGMRASFKTWSRECTTTAEAIVEACMTHAAADKIAETYVRGDFMEKRRAHMQAWASFVDPVAAEKVVPIGKGRRKKTA
jgi:integrase